MITIVGVGHIFQISKQVKEVIQAAGPRAVCVELDPGRYRALVSGSGETGAGLVYRLLALFQKRIARQYSGEVGQEMVAAVEAAVEGGAAVVFIDDDVAMVFRRIWERMPIGEKMRLMFSALYGFFMNRKRMEEELDRFQENEEAYLFTFEQQFPTLKKVLIDDRNHAMADRIRRAEERYGDVVAVVGDGHVEGIRQLLMERNPEVIRLRELRKMAACSGGAISKASFSFTITTDD